MFGYFLRIPLTGEDEEGRRRERTRREERIDERKGKLPFLKQNYVRHGTKLMLKLILQGLTREKENSLS